MTREQIRFGEEVSQTLKLLTVTRPELIEKVTKHIAEGVPATILAGRVNCAQIYRAKNQFLRLRENISFLTEAMTKLYAVLSDERCSEPFPVTLNVDREQICQGYLWQSIRNGTAYRTAELKFFTLHGNDYVPYSIV